MTVSPPLPPLHLELISKYPSDERLGKLTKTLSEELRGIGVSVSVPAETSSEAGAKGDPLTVGALVLAVAPALLPKLMDFIKEWGSRAEGTVSTVTLKAVVNGQVLELQYPSNAPPRQETVLAFLEALSRANSPR